MNKTLLKSLLGATCLSLAMVGAASAGGFARGNADTDLIYEDGNFNMRSSLTYVSPSREYTRNGNPALVGTEYTDDYVIPSFAVKLNVVDNFRCAATHVMNMGGSVTYAAPTLSGKVREEFDTYESAITCGAKFQVGPGNLWILGGGFMEKFDYYRQNDFSALRLPTAELTLGGEDFGYRAGIAYEVPEIALRAQLMYRSGTEYGADGTLNAPVGVLCARLPTAPFCGLPLNTKIPVPAVGVGELPQTVELKVQSGIAPGWLAFGSVKWSDWSVMTSLDVNAQATGTNISRDSYFWQDGWTVTAGVGHAFNDRVSGLVALTWDKGVGTGWDLSSDTWTLALGGSVKDNIGGELRAGLGFTYITSAAETQYSPTGTGIRQGVNSAVDSGYAIAGNIGYAIKW